MKQTEVGLIPDDWEVKILGEITSHVDYRGKTPQKTNQGIQLITAKNIRMGYIDYKNNQEFVSEKDYAEVMKRGLPLKGDVLITTEAPAGNVAQIENEKIALAQRVIKYRGKDNLDNTYLCYYFLSNTFQSLLQSFNTGGTVQGIKGSLLHKLPVILPPKTEQQRIAKALSDVDALITTTEKLIQKKKNIKQGTMQNLLTGKKRLPGFAKSTEYKQTDFGIIPTDWKLFPLSSLIADISDGPFGSNLKTEHYTTEKEARIIQLSNVGEDGWNDENTKYTTYLHAQEIKRCIVPYGSIVVAKMMPAGRAIICPNIDKMYVLGSDCVRISPNALLDSMFFVCFSKTSFYLEQIKDNTQGSTRARTSVSKLKTIKIALPQKEEQIAIANILSSMDKEIQTLNTKLEKYRNLKTAMMQQLLTGKIRLK